VKEKLMIRVLNQQFEVDTSGAAGGTPALGRRLFLKRAVAGAALASIPNGFIAAEHSHEPVLPANRKLKVGLVGCGSVSRAYLPGLVEAEYIELVSVCDIIPERARKAATTHGVPNHFASIEEQLRGGDLDLLVNTTSMPSHYSVNSKALEAKVNVWTEKPMALEVGQANELLESARKNGVQIWAAPTCVTSPQFRFMAEMAATGRLGRITAGHGTYGHEGPTWSAWFYEKGGGSLYDLGVYNVTTLTGLLGPAKEVVGMTAVLNPFRKVDDKGEVAVEADENTMLIMHHGNGLLSHVQTGFVYFDGERAPSRERRLYTVDIMGTEGAMHLQGWDWAPVAVDVASRGKSILEPHCRDEWPYEWVGGALYVARCLLNGEKSLITAEHGLHVLEVMNACHESQRTGRRIPVTSTFPWPIIGPDRAA
jgi:predicted dehydrogenase